MLSCVIESKPRSSVEYTSSPSVSYTHLDVYKRQDKVKAIFVNIFGGIVRCDMIAEGIIAAVKDVGVKIPVIVRLEGTNVEAGKDLLKNSGLAIIPADDINDGAKKAVAAVAGQ